MKIETAAVVLVMVLVAFVGLTGPAAASATPVETTPVEPQVLAPTVNGMSLQGAVQDLGDQQYRIGWFADNFNDNVKDAQWVQEGGTWTLSGGSSQFSTNTRIRTTVGQWDTSLGAQVTMTASGSGTNSGRLLFRWKDASNYHYLDLNPKSGTLSLYKVVSGTATKIWSAKPSGGIAIGTPYLVKVDAKGGSFVIGWKGATLAQPTDPSSPAPGGIAAIGFATVGSATTMKFDDVRAWTGTIGSVITDSYQYTNSIGTVHSVGAFNGVDILDQVSDDNVAWGEWHYIKANAKSQTLDDNGYFIPAVDRYHTYARFRIDLRTTDDTSPSVAQIMAPYGSQLLGGYLPGQGMGSEPSQYYIGGMVNSVSRNVFLQGTDLSLPGKGWSIRFLRSYNDLSTNAGPLGIGWTHSYNVFLTAGTRVVNFTDGDGSIHTFEDMGNGLFSPPPGLLGVKLVRNADNTYAMSWKDGVRWAFTAAGILTQMTDRNGNKLTFTYDANSRLVKVADDTGIYIALGYDPSGRISRVSDFNGTSSTMSPASQVGAWTSGGNALSSNNLYASTKSSSALHDFYNYHITSPGSSAVEKVEACVEAYSAGDDRIGVKISTNGGSSWSPEQVVTLPAADPNSLTCRDFTSSKNSWAWSDLSDANFRVQARYAKVGGQASYVYLDWIPVRVTAAGRTVTYAYDASGRLSSVTDPLLASSLFTYAADGRLEKYVDRADKVLRFVHGGGVYDNLLSVYAGRYDRANGVILWQYLMYDITFYGGRLFDTRVYDALGGYTMIDYDPYMGVPDYIQGPLAALGGFPGCSCGGGCSGGGSSAGTDWWVQWDGELQCVRRTDARGNTVVTAYDWRGNVIKSTDALGYYTENTWQNRDSATAFDSLLMTQSNKRGYWSHNEYDAKGNLVKAFDALDNYTQNFFDPTGLLTQSRDKRGFGTFYGYDSHGWQTTVTDPLGHVTRTDYDTVGRRVKTTTPIGIASSSTHNGNDWVTSERNDLGFTTMYEYNGRGDRVANVDANGNRTTIEVNVTCPQATRTTDPTGAVTEKICDRLGRLVQVNDPNGKAWKYEYDQYGRKTREVDPNGFATRFTYDAAGSLVTRIDADGRQLDNSYDALSRVTQTQENKTAMDNMEVGGLWSYTEVGGASFLAGADGGYSTAQSSSPTHSVYAQFSGGNADGTDWGVAVLGKWYDSTRIDTLSVAFYIDWFQHNGDSWDKMDSGVRIRLYDSMGTNFANYTYWLASWYLGQDYKDVPTDGYTVRIYNGRPPMNAWTTFSRDPNRDWTIDWARTANVRIELYVAATGTWGTPTNQFRIYLDDFAVGHKADLLTYQYDAVGNGVQEAGFGYTRTRTYDALDRVSSMTFDFGGFQKTVQYTYDENGNRKTMVYPDGFTVTYIWNGDGLLTGMQAPGQSWTFRYDADHRRTAAVHPNGLELNYTYDDANRLTAARTKKTADGSLVDGNSYTYDKMTNRKTKTHENDNKQMAFDYQDNYMLEGTTYSDGTTASYVYDSNGNRIYRNYGTESQSYWYDESSNLTRRDVYLGGTLRISDLYSYDNAGNRIRWTNTIVHRGTTSYDYAYDVEGRLTSVSVDGYEITSYAYFVDGARIRKTEIGTPSYFLYDFKDFSGYEDILEQYDANGAVIARFIQGPGIDEPLAMQYGGSSYYYHFDGLGSVTMLTRADQTVANRYEYDDFGGYLTRQESVPNFYGYTGREYDSQVDLVYMRARYYDPSIGRFLARDPSGMVDGPNVYAYAGNNPISRVDPSGRDLCLPALCIKGWNWIWPIFGFRWCIVEWKMVYYLYQRAGVIWAAAQLCIWGLGVVWYICSTALSIAWGLLITGQIWAAIGAASVCAGAIAQWCGWIIFWILLGVLATGYCT